VRVDRVIRDELKSLSRVLEALDHNLTARDNLAPEGEVGWVLTSRGADQVPEYAPVSLEGSTLPWSSITDTPNTLAGYGIANAYTITEVNSLIATHTHDASAIVSGILNPSRLGSGAADAGKYLRGDSTWQPLSLAGLGIASEVANIASAPRWDEPGDDWPLMIPGPKGDKGDTGAAGSGSGSGGTTLQLRQEEFYEENWTIPGPAGAAGPAGSTGPTGPGTILVQLNEDYTDSWADMHLPGERGLTGPQGPTGPGVTVIQLNEEYTEPWAEMLVPGAAGAPGSAGSAGAAGAQGPPGQDGEPADDWPVMIPGNTGPQGSQGIQGPQGPMGYIYTYWDDSIDPDLSALMAFGQAAAVSSAGGGISGSGTPGKIPKWTGATALGDSLLTEGTNAITMTGTTAGVFTVDANSASYRWREADQGVDQKLWEAQAEGAALLFTAVNDAVTAANIWLRAIRGTGTAVATIELYGDTIKFLNDAGTTTWSINTSTHLVTGTDNTSDIGTTGALRPRDIYLAGALIEQTLSKVTAADQASFANVQTNITGLSFTGVANAIYSVDVVLATTMAGSTAGVKYYWTASGTSTGEKHVVGNSTSLALFLSFYEATITVPGSFIHTAVMTAAWSYHRFIIRMGGTGGTCQLVGITGGATTTAVVKKGASILVKRLS
jgi:Collagen triple helix repeat (20 copies)